MTDEIPEVLPEVALLLVKKQNFPLPTVVVARILTTERTMALMHLGATYCLDVERSQALPSAVEVAAAAAVNTLRQLTLEQAQQTRQSRQEHRMMLLLINRIRQSLDLETIFQTSTSEIYNFLEVDRVIIYQFDAQFFGKTVAESLGADWPQTMGADIVDTCFRKSRGSHYTRDQIFTIDDIYTAGLTPCHIALLERFKVRASLVVPIFHNGQVWGLLMAHQCSGSRVWRPGEVDLLHHIATHLTIAIRQAEWALLAKEHQAREERDQLLIVVEAMRQAVGLPAILNATVHELRRTLQADRVVVYRFNDDWSGTFVAEAVTSEWKSLIDLHDCDEVLQRNVAHYSENILGTNRPSVTDTYLQNSAGNVFSHPANFRTVEDIYQADFAECHIRLLEGYQARAYMIMPLFIESDKLWGLLAVYQNTGPRRWKESDVNLLYQVATQLSMPLLQAVLYQASLAQVVELENLVHLKDDFLSTVSHELRTPVSNMRLAIHMLKQTTDEARRKKYLAILESECGREKSLINELLDLQRFDTSGCPLKLEHVALGEWLPPVVAPFLNRANECEQSLVIQVSPTLSVICTEIASLERIVAELLNNACKYTPAGEQITIALSQTGDQLELSVINTGAEIPQAELLRVFEKFYRLPNNDLRSQGGTGLGLALVQCLTKRLCGQILVKSENRITTFTIMLPLDLSLDHCQLPTHSLEAKAFP
ncbi:MAG: GAF domain-containing protein [Anaerolineae bacterium]|nr:GAF domain-containing protein [Gloeobacterales cyanobacterium ES-bin-313]